MKHPFAAALLLVHLFGIIAIARLSRDDDANNGNFIGVGLIAAILAVADLAIGSVVVFRWLF
jgi:hypothetical protein